jgi:hypothetical protein
VTIRKTHIPHPVFWVSKGFLRSTFTRNFV